MATPSSLSAHTCSKNVINITTTNYMFASSVVSDMLPFIVSTGLIINKSNVLSGHFPGGRFGLYGYLYTFDRSSSEIGRTNA